MSDLISSLRALTPAEWVGLFALVAGGLFAAWLVARPASVQRHYMVKFRVWRGERGFPSVCTVLARSKHEARRKVLRNIIVPPNVNVTITLVTEI